MKIDKTLLDELTAAAKENLRLRTNYDLRTSSADSSQRMLNAMEPGTIVPIHRHTTTTEDVVILRGKGIQYLYDNDGNVVDEVLLEAGTTCAMMVVEKGRWHRFEVLESGTVIFEAKDGEYTPISSDDILSI